MTWTQPYSGRAVDLLTPRVEDIDSVDIAVHLARTSRFAGATDYNNAQHSILVASIVWQLTRSRLAACYGLTHDAHEAYMGDVIGPMRAALKQLLGQAFKDAMNQITQGFDDVIFQALQLPPITDDLRTVVTAADRRALFIERKLFLAPPPRPWPGETTPYEETYQNAIADGINIEWNRHILPSRSSMLAFRYMLEVLRGRTVGPTFYVPSEWYQSQANARFNVPDAFPGLTF